MDKKKNERPGFIQKVAMSAAVGLMLPLGRVLGANDRVRLRIIEPGARGQELMKQALALPNVEFTAADVYTRRRDETKATIPTAKIYADHRQLLDSKDVDAVIVATPLHCGFIKSRAEFSGLNAPV